MNKGNIPARSLDGRAPSSLQEAAHIVDHARWQNSRGRNPSETGLGQNNSRRALEMAKMLLADTYEVHAHASRPGEGGVDETLNVAVVVNAMRASGDSGTSVYEGTLANMPPADPGVIFELGQKIMPVVIGGIVFAAPVNKDE